MKKVLLFVLAAMFAYTMNAQTLFSESFESGDLSSWTLTDSDGDGNNWTAITGYGSNTVAPQQGSYFVISQSWISGTGGISPDNWMVSNEAITITEAGFNLVWYEGGTTYDGEHYAIYLSASNDISSMTTAVFEGDNDVANAGDWTRKSVSLDAYVGQTVYVAFRHFNSYDNEMLAIDNIQISKASSTPSIELTSVDLGSTYGYVGDAFQVKGTVTNLSTAALTSFSVSYTVGSSSSTVYNVTGINVAMGETYEFTHPDAPAYVLGDNTVTVTVSNPNGVADDASDNSKSAEMYVVECNVNALPYTMGFEQGVIDDCWHIMDTSAVDNAAGYLSYAGYPYYYPFAVRTGQNALLFAEAGSMSYTQVELPAGASMINLSGYVMLSFDANNQYGSAVMSVLVSTTGTDRADFSVVGGNFIDVTSNDFVEFTADLTAYAGQTVYVAIKHEQGAWIIVDDITIEAVNDTPEIALISNTTPTNVSLDSPFNVSGVVKNNSASALTSFDVTYTLDGNTAAVMNVTGINLAYGETYEFTHNTPATLATGGNHSLVITVSNPNGVADNTADNTVTATVTGCGTVTAPFTETFNNGLGCWQAIDANNDGYNWMMSSELIATMGWNTTSDDYDYEGSGDAVVSESYRNYVGEIQADNWLISPAIVMPASGSYAAKWYDMGDYGDEYSVYVGTSSDIATLAAGTPLYTGAVEEDYVQRGISLDQFNGQTIYVAFHHNFYDGYDLYIDQFSVEEVSTTPEIALTSATAPSTIAINTPYVVNGTIVNNSGAALTSFDAAVTINGQTTNQQFTGINVPYMQSYSFAVDMPAIATAGNYTITVTVSNPNGVADNTSDNTQTTAINAYDASTSVPRTVLLENFTTAACQYCPSGHDRVEAAIGTNYANNVIWVSHHSGYGTDDLTSQLDQTMMTFYNDNSTYAPAIMLDRTYWGEQAFTYYDGEYAPGPVFLPQSDVADALALSTAEPAFVTVNLGNVNYNATTRALSVTVSGNVSGALATNDARLNVWLLEDGLVADGQTGVGHGPRQRDANSATGYIDNFIHNHVIRENLSGDDWGEAGIVTPTAGTNYSKTYTTTVSNDYDASKCYIVAFVSSGNHSDVNNCKVFNAGKSSYITTGDTPGPGPEPGVGIDDVTANSVKLYPNPTTGNLFIEVEGLQKVEVIDAVGRVVMTETNSTINMSNLANGIYTVRVTANGNTAVKKVVKK